MEGKQERRDGGRKGVKEREVPIHSSINVQAHIVRVTEQNCANLYKSTCSKYTLDIVTDFCECLTEKAKVFLFSYDVTLLKKVTPNLHVVFICIVRAM